MTEPVKKGFGNESRIGEKINLADLKVGVQLKDSSEHGVSYSCQIEGYRGKLFSLRIVAGRQEEEEEEEDIGDNEFSPSFMYHDNVATVFRYSGSLEKISAELPDYETLFKDRALNKNCFFMIQRFKIRTLESFVNTQNMKFNDGLFQITIGILRGMCHLHNYQIVHRDLRSSNIFFCSVIGCVIIGNFDYALDLRKNKEGFKVHVDDELKYSLICPFSHQTLNGDHVAPEIGNIDSEKRGNMILNYEKYDMYSFGVMIQSLISEHLEHIDSKLYQKKKVSVEAEDEEDEGEEDNREEEEGKKEEMIESLMTLKDFKIKYLLELSLKCANENIEERISWDELLDISLYLSDRRLNNSQVELSESTFVLTNVRSDLLYGENFAVDPCHRVVTANIVISNFGKLRNSGRGGLVEVKALATEGNANVVFSSILTDRTMKGRVVSIEEQDGGSRNFNNCGVYVMNIEVEEEVIDVYGPMSMSVQLCVSWVRKDGVREERRVGLKNENCLEFKNPFLQYQVRTESAQPTFAFICRSCGHEGETEILSSGMGREGHEKQKFVLTHKCQPFAHKRRVELTEKPLEELKCLHWKGNFHEVGSTDVLVKSLVCSCGQVIQQGCVCIETRGEICIFDSFKDFEKVYGEVVGHVGGGADFRLKNMEESCENMISSRSIQYFSIEPQRFFGKEESEEETDEETETEENFEDFGKRETPRSRKTDRTVHVEYLIYPDIPTYRSKRSGISKGKETLLSLKSSNKKKKKTMKKNTIHEGDLLLGFVNEEDRKGLNIPVSDLDLSSCVFWDKKLEVCVSRKLGKVHKKEEEEKEEEERIRMEFMHKENYFQFKNILFCMMDENAYFESFESKLGFDCNYRNKEVCKRAVYMKILRQKYEKVKNNELVIDEHNIPEKEEMLTEELGKFLEKTVHEYSTMIKNSWMKRSGYFESRGEALMKLGRYDEALRDYVQSSEIHQYYCRKLRQNRLLLTRSVLLLHLKQVEEADVLFEAYLEIFESKLIQNEEPFEGIIEYFHLRGVLKTKDEVSKMLNDCREFRYLWDEDYLFYEIMSYYLTGKGVEERFGELENLFIEEFLTKQTGEDSDVLLQKFNTHHSISLEKMSEVVNSLMKRRKREEEGEEEGEFDENVVLEDEEMLQQIRNHYEALILGKKDTYTCFNTKHVLSANIRESKPYKEEVMLFGEQENEGKEGKLHHSFSFQMIRFEWMSCGFVRMSDWLNPGLHELAALDCNCPNIFRFESFVRLVRLLCRLIISYNSFAKYRDEDDDIENMSTKKLEEVEEEKKKKKVLKKREEVEFIRDLKTVFNATEMYDACKQYWDKLVISAKKVRQEEVANRNKPGAFDLEEKFEECVDKCSVLDVQTLKPIFDQRKKSGGLSPVVVGGDEGLSHWLIGGIKGEIWGQLCIISPEFMREGELVLDKFEKVEKALTALRKIVFFKTRHPGIYNVLKSRDRAFYMQRI